MSNSSEYNGVPQDAPYQPSVHPLMSPKDRLKVWERAREALEPHADDMLAHIQESRKEWE